MKLGNGIRGVKSPMQFHELAVAHSLESMNIDRLRPRFFLGGLHRTCT